MELTLTEIAAGLNVAKTTLERWVRQGRIPVHRVDNSYRFNLSVLERWAERNNLTFVLPSAPVPTRPPLTAGPCGRRRPGRNLSRHRRGQRHQRAQIGRRPSDPASRDRPRRSLRSAGPP